MLSSQSRKGQKLAGHQNPVLDQNVVKLLKTQDAGYVATMLQKTKRALAKLEQEIVLNEGNGVELPGAFSSQKKGSHRVFLEGGGHYKPEYKVAFRPDSTKKLEIPSMNEEVDGSDRQPWVQDLPISRGAVKRQELASKQDELLCKHRRKEQDARKSKLAALNAREKNLIEAENELDLQRAKMSNSVGGVTKAGAKWKVRERKK